MSGDGPRAEERPGALRAGDGGGPRRRGDAARRRSRRCRGSAAPARTCSTSRRSSRASAAGAARCAAAVGRWYAAQPVGRARLPGGQVPPARRLDAPRPAAPRPPGEPGRARATRRSTCRRSTRACSSGSSAAASTDGLPRIVEGFARAQAAATPAEAAELVREYGLPREALQTEHLTSPEVWEALLEDMPMTALIRNLATMTRVGLLAPGSAGTAKVVAQLGDAERLRRARVHPIARARGAPDVRGRPRRPRPRRVEPGARDRRRARRRVLRGVRQRRADRQAAAARARRVGLDDVAARSPACRA